jgi:hypothetical protein
MPMTTMLQRVQELVSSGSALTLENVGGEDVVLADRSWPMSSVFGDVAEILLAAWTVVVRKGELIEEIVRGLLKNSDPFAVSHALAVIGASSEFELRPAVAALDRRVRDEDGSEAIRVLAASGIVRYALREPRWRSTASAAMQYLEDFSDDYAVSMMARLAAFAWTSFRDSTFLEVLERCTSSSQATYERGVIELGLAFEQDSLTTIAQRLENAERWFERATHLDDERRDAPAYRALTKILRSFTHGHSVIEGDLSALKALLKVRAQWDAPASGWEWLQPPAEADLQWIPLLDSIAAVSERLSESSWLNAYEVLGEALKLYCAKRAIRPGLAGIERLVVPTIEAAFVRERGLLAHLSQMIDRGVPSGLSVGDAERLRRNVEEARLRDEGKAKGARATGESRPRHSPPD